MKFSFRQPSSTVMAFCIYQTKSYGFFAVHMNGKKPDNLCLCRYTAYFAAFGYFEATWRMYLATMVVSLSAAFAESLPLPLDDNFTVPFVAVAVGMLLLPF